MKKTSILNKDKIFIKGKQNYVSVKFDSLGAQNDHIIKKAMTSKETLVYNDDEK